MHEFTGSALRILAGLVIGLALLLALAFWGVRLPGVRSQPWPGGPRAHPARLEGHVRALARTDPPRSAAHPEGLARAPDYVTAALACTRATVAEQHYRAEGQGYRNLVARFGPATGPVVVVGAHYDVFGALPGADDNASGVAGLLELALMLDAHGPELATAVELVAYSTEEPPFFGGRQMGSSVHARGLQAGGAEVRQNLRASAWLYPPIWFVSYLLSRVSSGRQDSRRR